MDMLKALLIAVTGGFISSFLFVAALYLIRPKLAISPWIADSPNLEGITTYKFKVVNRRYRKVINLKAELHIIRPFNLPGGTGKDTKELKLKRPQVLCLAPYKHTAEGMEFEFRFKTEENLREMWEDEGGKCLRFQVSGTDAFSNITQIFTHLYFKKTCIKKGSHLIGASLEVEELA